MYKPVSQKLDQEGYGLEQSQVGPLQETNGLRRLF